MRRSIALLCPLLAACLGVTDAGNSLNLPSGPGKRVLFIGNSLTYANDLPGVVAALSVAAGDTAWQVRWVAFPDFALEDHWTEGTARRALREARWDVVVMQQGPSSLPENQVHLRDWALKLEPEIRAAGAQPALYMVWPSRARSADFPAVHTAYRDAAIAVRGLFLPAGDAWLRAWARDSTLALYGPDDFHPSALGTVLAALVIYEKLSGRSVVGLPAPAVLPLPAGVLRTLQEAAHESAVAAARLPGDGASFDGAAPRPRQASSGLVRTRR